MAVKRRTISREDMIQTLQSCTSIDGASKVLHCGRTVFLRHLAQYGLSPPRCWKKSGANRVKKLVLEAISRAGSYHLEDVLYSMGDIANEKESRGIKTSEVAEMLEKIKARRAAV